MLYFSGITFIRKLQSIFFFVKVLYVSNFMIIEEENGSSFQVLSNKVLSKGKTNFY